MLLLCVMAATAALHAQDTSNAQGRWRELVMPYQPDPVFQRYTPAVGDDYAGIRFESADVGYARWLNGFEYQMMRTTDRGRTWSEWPHVTPHQGARVHGNWGVVGAAEFNTPTGPLIAPAITQTGPTGWRMIDSTTMTLVHGTFPDTGLPRVMARFYSERGLTRLAYTLDGGDSWMYADSVVPVRIDTIIYSPTKIRYDTLFGVQYQALFGPAPTDYSGLVRWGTLLGIEDSVLYLTSSVMEGPNSGTWHWRIDLPARKAVLTHVPLQVDSYLYMATWISPTLMLAPIGSSSSPAVARSTNKGLNWEVIPTTEQLHVPTLKFLSPTYGICRNMYTVDAGRTWRRWHVPFDTTLDDFYALDSLRWFARATINKYPSFRWTTDGGRTWEGIQHSVTNGVWAGNGVMLVVYGADGIMRTHDTRPGTDCVLRTRDSGETWQRVRMPDDFFQIGPVAQVDPRGRPGELIMIALVRRFTFHSSELIASRLRSTDTGATWTVMDPVPELSKNLWQVYDPRGDITPIMTFVPSTGRPGRTGFLLAQDRYLYSSPDSGATWERTSDTQIKGYSMANDRIGIAARDHELLRTEDGGATWIYATSLFTTQPRAQGLMMFDTLDCSAIVPDLSGPGNSVVHSRDGGRTWTQRLGGGTLNLFNPFHWVSRSCVYSTSGDIVRSMDSGRFFFSVHPSFRYGNHEGSFYDGTYIYYLRNADTITQIGRWRVDEKESGPAEAPGFHEPAAGVRLRLEGRPTEAIVVHVDPSSGSDWEARLIDMRGSEIERRHGEGGEEARFDARSLPSGAYMVVLRRSRRVDALRVLLMK